MVTATQVIPFMDGFAKYLSPYYPPWQLTWCRFFFHLAALLPVLLVRFDRRSLWPRQPLLQIARGGFLMVATAFFFAAIATIPLATALALLFSYPFLVTVLSPLVLGEPVAPRQWAAVVVGFLGILVILRPGLEVVEPGSLFALAAGGAYSLYFLSTRKLSGTAHPLVTLAYTAVFGAFVLSLAAPAFWVMPKLSHLPYMAGIGFTAAVGHYLLILAFERAPASLLAPLGYGEILMATLIGYFAFDDFPDGWTWLGIGLVIASGIDVVLYEQRRARRDASPPVVEALEPPG